MTLTLRFLGVPLIDVMVLHVYALKSIGTTSVDFSMADISAEDLAIGVIVTFNESLAGRPLGRASLQGKFLGGRTLISQSVSRWRIFLHCFSPVSLSGSGALCSSPYPIFFSDFAFSLYYYGLVR